MKRLADYAVREGTENTTDGRWSVSYDELYYHFGEETTDANENGKLLEEELRQREEINELIMTEDANINSFLKCVAYRSKGKYQSSYSLPRCVKINFENCN